MTTLEKKPSFLLWVGSGVASVTIFITAGFVFGVPADIANKEQEFKDQERAVAEQREFADVTIIEKPGGVDEIVGVSPVGGPFVWESGGKTIVGVFSHWCETCPEQLEGFQNWLRVNTVDSDGDSKEALFEGFAVFTDVRPNEGNWPQFLWLRTISWSERSVLDDQEGSLRKLFGVKSYPLFIEVSADGKFERYYTTFDELPHQNDPLVNSISGGSK